MTACGVRQGKVSTYALQLVNGSRHIRLEHMTLFGTTVYASRSHVDMLPVAHISLTSLRFRYPAYSRRMLGVAEPPLVTELSGPGFYAESSGAALYAGCWDKAACAGATAVKGIGCCQGYFTLINNT